MERMKDKEDQGLLFRFFMAMFLVAVLAILGVFYWHQRSQEVAANKDSFDEPEPIVRKGVPLDQVGVGGSSEDTPSLKVDAQKYQLALEEDNQSALKLSAESALVADLESGKILYSKNIHKRLFPASVTKIATAMVAKSSFSGSSLVTVSETAASQEPNIMGLKSGEKLPVNDLIFGLLINSGNDAAYALAEADRNGYQNFVKKMNDLAASLSLKDTHFSNPSGLHAEDHYSSAYDIAVLMRYLQLEHSELLPIMRTEEKLLPATETHGSYYLKALSVMLKTYPGIIAVKTGYTPEAGHTWVAIAKNERRSIIVSFFNSWSSSEDAKKLLEFGLGS